MEGDPEQGMMRSGRRWLTVLGLLGVTVVPSVVPPAEAQFDEQLGAPPPLEEIDAAEGARIFKLLKCSMCHGDQGRGDGPNSASLSDDAGWPISPRNLTRVEEFKYGHSLADIALTVSVGVPGTPMPSYQDSLLPGEIWPLALFVQGFTAQEENGPETTPIQETQ